MKRLSLFLGTSLCFAAAARAGVIVHEEVVKTLGATREGQTTIYVQSGMVRIENSDSRGRLERFTLFRDGAIWKFQPSAHTYAKFDRASMEQMTANLPPQARAMMEKVRAAGSASGDGVPWRDTGKTGHVDAYSCRVWEGAAAGEKEEMCIVPFTALPGGDELSAAMQQMGRTLKEIMSVSPFGSSLTALARYSTFNGIPASTRSNTIETRLTSVQRTTIPADVFQIPQGYEQEMDWRHGPRTAPH
jgi:hypothetical protein